MAPRLVSCVTMARLILAISSSHQRAGRSQSAGALPEWLGLMIDRVKHETDRYCPSFGLGFFGASYFGPVIWASQ